jgi:tetratricopeptide (TPR) repeat protein
LRALLEQLAVQQVGPESWARVKLALGQVQALLGEGDGAAASYQEALAHISDLPDSPTVRSLKASVCRWLAELYHQQGRYALTLDWVQKGLDALSGRETPDAAELALLAFYVHLRQCDYDRALRQAEYSLRLGQQLDHPPVLARAHNGLGIILHRREESGAALEHYRQALALYQQIGDAIGAAKSRNLIGGALFTMGQWGEAERHFRQAHALFDQLQEVHYCTGLRNNLGFIALRQGRFDTALEEYRSGLELLERVGGYPYLQGLLHAGLGDVLIRRGDVPAARQHLQTSLARCQQIEARDFLPELYRLMAEAALLNAGDDDAGGDLAEAEAQAQHSLALAREMQTQGEEGRSLRILGEIAQARGQLDLAETYLDQSSAIFVGLGDEYEAARGQLALARLYTAQAGLGGAGKREAALSALEACAPVLERLEAAPELEAARTLRVKLDNHAQR